MKRFRSHYTISPPIPPDPIIGCMNPLANNFNPLANTPGDCTYTPSSLKAIISESPGNEYHGLLVKKAFDDEYGTTNDSQIYTQGTSNIVRYAKGAGIPVVNRSYVSASGNVLLAKENYPEVIYVMPIGSNQHIEIDFPMSELVCIGACALGFGDDNDTAYGSSLDFWDYEDDNVLGADESSLSCPVIAAKLLKIKEGRNCGHWEARYCARITAIRTEARRPEGVLWTKFDGFGRIDIIAAINYNGSIPDDPFLNDGNKYLPYIP